jgi:hypothetical protein
MGNRASIFLLLLLLVYSCKEDEYPVSFDEITNSTISSNTDTIINWYYSNGEIRRSSRFLDGKPFGATNTFYSNGHLKNCFFLNSKIELIYKADYFEDGSFINSEGKPIYFKFNPKRDSLKVNKKFELAIIAPKIPIGDTNVILGEEKEGGIEILYRHKMNNHGVLFQHSMAKVGRQNIPIIIEIEHGVNTIEKDTTWIEVLAYE